VIAVDATTGAVTSLGADTMPFVLGGVRCYPGAGDLCFVGDAEQNVLRRWQVASLDGGDAGAAFTPLSGVVVDPTVGLPPRDIGGL
jgi:hypothetical protein